jgi:four helix bundle protein
MTYTDLEVWKSARELVKLIYLATKEFPADERFGLTNQMRRCSVSIPSNIAEGCGRQHDKDSINFFFISRGSLYELETQVYVACDLGYIKQDELNLTLEKTDQCKKLINGFINYYKSKNNAK